MNSVFDVTRDQLERIPSIRSAFVFADLASTNTWSLEHLPEFHHELPCLVVAKEQTAGRGRGRHQWWSSAGALTFSHILPPQQNAPQLPQTLKQELAFVAALALRDAILPLLPDPMAMQFKWPNDVYYHGKKLSGMLIEGHPLGVVVGIGVNVNNSLAAAPPEIREKSISLCDITQEFHSLTTILRRYVAAMDQWDQRDTTEIHTTWSQHCLLSDRIVTVNVFDKEIAGRCLGINQQGHLILMTERGMEEIIAGSIVHFE
jgi:BirA family biotin operon repressor/biotin-[acetyl-CoA-carboxylase] ligase